jgi:hypothetical protein
VIHRPLPDWTFCKATPRHIFTELMHFEDTPE